jgi:hypothetical protein
VATLIAGCKRCSALRMLRNMTDRFNALSALVTSGHPLLAE